MAKLSLDKILLKAKAHTKKGENKEALELYEVVLKKFPNNKRAQKGFASSKKILGFPNGKSPPQEDINELVNLYNIGKFSTVVEKAKILSREYPKAFILWNILGAAKKNLGLFDDAFEAFKKVTELNSNYADGFNNLGVILKEQGKLDEALIAYKKALLIKPDYLEVCFNIGNIFKEQKKLKEALVFYKKAISINPDYEKAYNNMGITLKEQGKFEEAIVFYKKALLIKPKYAEVYNNIGNVLKEQRKLDEALDSYKEAVIIKPNYFEAYFNIGNVLKEQENLEEAIDIYKKVLVLNPNHADTFINMGEVFQTQGNFDDAIIAFNKAIEINPYNPEVFNNRGISLKEQGKLDESLVSYQKALSLNSDYPAPYNNMGNVLKELGKLEEAIDNYKKAISLESNYLDAHNNMANTLKEQGRLKEAIDTYKMILSFNPNYVAAYINWGNTLKEQEKLDEALVQYQKALSINPKNALIYNNMGNVFKKQNKLNGALYYYKKALALKPDFTAVLSNFGNVLQHYRFEKYDQEIEEIIILLFDRKTLIRPRNIARAVISLVKLNPHLSDEFCIEFKIDDLMSLNKIILKLLKLPLLIKLMSLVPVPDLAIERIYSKIREKLLLFNSELEDSKEILEFQTALALQCYTNEYIYFINDEEIKALEELEISILSLFKKGKQPSPSVVLCMASYKALYQYEWHNKIKVNKHIEEVFKSQVTEPIYELKLKSSIPILEEITNKISSKVREQYESNPYPRWVDTKLIFNPLFIYEMVNGLKLKLFDNSIINVKKPKILIAGCGTGQHSLFTKSNFKNSTILAVDLSLSSLAYAKRKTEEYKSIGIEYMQADILDLKKLGREFDIVESVGVLHHMDDPMNGWRVLTSCLKKGGLMKIGLYSELARKNIVKIKEKFKKSNIYLNKKEIIDFRRILCDLKNNDYRFFHRINDFYSLSEFRDLLLHTQEHRFTIPQIQRSLASLGLKFCGFDDDKIIQNFKLLNKEKHDLYDLNKWKLYEEANPIAFIGMYQFWCQKLI